MGKQKKKSDNRNEKFLKMPSNKRQQLNEYSEILLKKCTEVKTNKDEWKDYEEIYNMVQKIRDIEKDYNVSLPNRDENWDCFLSWCSDAGANYKAVQIKKLKDEEYGLVSNYPLKEDDVILQVPRKLMMTATTISDSVLGNFIKKDPILQHMPNIVLALHLMNEYVNQDSFWKPYLSILPAEYNTTLYFTPEDLKELTGSPVKEECIKMFRNIARQYSYFYRQFQLCPELRSSSLRHCFTYDFYRWAVSTVMTRQNAVPSSDGNDFFSALIPLWDMTNHMNGKISTDYNIKENCLECMAMKNFDKDEEVYIFYGARSNAEFFVHNGFVYPESQYDTTLLKFGISKNDPLFSLKSQLCAKLDIPISGNFYLHSGDEPIDKKLLFFVIILVMKEDDLKKWLQMNDILSEYNNPQSQLDLPILEAMKYLETRISLLLKMYNTSVQEDEKLSESNELLPRQRMIFQLRYSEKKILQKALNYAANYKKL